MATVILGGLATSTALNSLSCRTLALAIRKISETGPGAYDQGLPRP